MSNTPENTNKRTTEGRRLLTDGGNVYCPSLPHSLRHCAKDDALYDAEMLTRFLVEIAPYLGQSEIGLSTKGALGLERVLDLLLDKIEIGSGTYKFPLIGWKEDDPALAEREEDL
jgi:hypothetical protein